MLDVEMLAYDRVMPFDFITQRRTKKFFNQDQIDLDLLLQSKDKALQLLKKNYAKDFDEDQVIKDLPEIDEITKMENRIVPKKKKQKASITVNKKLIIKGELSSSSDDDKFNDYQFGLKVQNTQIRDQNNDLMGMYFQRSQAKNPRSKKQILQKLAEFKNKITREQREALQNRQFVVVDMKSLNHNKLTTFFNRRQDLKLQEEIEKEEKKKRVEYYLQKQSKLNEMAKQVILKEKSLYSSRNASMVNSITELRSNSQSNVKIMTSNDYSNFQYQTQIHTLNRNLITGASSTISSISNFDQSLNTRSLSPFNLNDPKHIYSNTAFGNVTSPYYQQSPIVSNQPGIGKSRLLTGIKQQALSLLKNQIFMEYENAETYLTKSHDKSLMRLTATQSPNSHFESANNKSHQNIDYCESSVKDALKSSPYQLIEQPSDTEKPKINYSYSDDKKTKIRGFLADKLRRKSVLNSELFKRKDINYKSRITKMVDKLNGLLGTSISKTREKE